MAAGARGWDDGMERAFLATLAETGRVDRAAAAIGRSVGAAQHRRQARAAFAEAWDAATATFRQARADHAQPVTGAVTVLPPETGDRFHRQRRDGWHPRKKETFLEALRANGSITDAARAVGMSTKSVYDLSAKDSGFQRACDQAMAAIRPSLLETAYQRAVVGVEDPVFHGGQVVGSRRKYSDAMLRLLIDRGFDPSKTPDASSGKAKWDGPGWPTQEEVDAELMKRLDELAVTLKRQDQRERIAWADRMTREGWAP